MKSYFRINLKKKLFEILFFCLSLFIKISLKMEENYSKNRYELKFVCF